MKKINKKIWKEKPKYDTVPCYESRILFPNKLSILVDTAASELLKFRKKSKFNAVACSGVSGLVLASALSYKIGIPIMCVRKPGDHDHSSSKVNGLIYDEYVIVDDLIDSGATVKRIIRNIQKCSVGLVAKPKAIFLYDSSTTYDKYFYYKDYKIPVFQL